MFAFCKIFPEAYLVFVFTHRLPLRQGLGVWPSHDPWNRRFSEQYYPSRMKKAGQSLCGPFKAVLDGIQGDADFIAAMFLLNRLLAVMYNNLYVFHPGITPLEL